MNKFGEMIEKNDSSHVEEKPGEPKNDNSEIVKTLMEKGYFSNDAEASEFAENLSETLQKSERIKNGIDDFQISLKKVIEDAENHLAEIENGGDVKLLDKGAEFKKIATELGADFDYLNSTKNENGGDNFAWKLGRWVAKHKAALVAFGVFSAAIRLGGGTAHASGEGGFDMASSESLEPSHESPEGNEIMEIHDLLEQSAAESHNGHSKEEIVSTIEQIKDEISMAQTSDDVVSVDFLSNQVDGKDLNVDGLQETLKTNGHLQFSVQSFSAVRDGMATEKIMSIEQLNGVGEIANHDNESMISVHSKGESPGQALLFAMDQLNDQLEFAVSSDVNVENAMLESSTTSLASKNIIDITTISIENNTTTDSSGVKHVSYSAHLIGRGV